MGDGAIGLSGGHELEHLELAPAEPVRAWRRPAHQRAHVLDVGRGAESLEDPAGGVELHGGAIVVAHGAEGERGEHADAGALVGRVELLPDGPRATELCQRLGMAALGEQDRALALRREGDEEWGVEVAGDRRELIRGGARGGDVARGERDLHESGKQAGAHAALGRLVERHADGRCRGAGVPLRETEEREPGLGLPSEAACLTI